MDTPILIDEREDEHRTPRRVPTTRIYILRIAAGLIGCVSSGLAIARVYATHTAPSDVPELPASIPVKFPPANSVCTEESRPNPSRGPWSCLIWTQLADGARSVQALDPGGPCTYRVVDMDSGYWRCTTNPNGP